MSKFYAWLLLVVSTVQWIGGHICFEVAYLVEAEQVMNGPEQAISSDIFEETGIEASVDILPEGQSVRWGADYGNYFAYSKTDSTGTVFFTIDYAPRTTVLEDFASSAPVGQHNDDAAQTSVLKLLFSEFLFTTGSLPVGKTDDLASNNFQVKQFRGNLRPNPLSPPPDYDFYG